MTDKNRAIPSGRAVVHGAGQAVSAVPTSVPIADICSERVLIACAAAKAVPGDVWGQGAEGHYAFLCGLAALLGNKSEELEAMMGHELRAAAGFVERFPDMTISTRCPDRILVELGFALPQQPAHPTGSDDDRRRG